MKKCMDTVSKGLVLGLVGLLVLGCQGLSMKPASSSGTEAQGTFTSDEQQLREQGDELNQSFTSGVISGIDKTILESALLGAGFGTAVAFGLKAANVDKIWSWATGAGITGISVLAGAYVASKQKTIGDDVKVRDDTIQKVKGQNEKTEIYIATARKVLKENKETLSLLKDKLNKGQVTQEQLESKRKTVESNREEVDASIKELEKQNELFQKTLEDLVSKNRDLDVSLLKQEIDDGASNIGELHLIEKDLVGTIEHAG
jgi:hypothetical protein